jgi:hypothetical protein
MVLRAILALSLMMVPFPAYSAEKAPVDKEITSVVGEVVVGSGSLKGDARARKEIESIARRLAKLPGLSMIEIEGAYPSALREEAGTGSSTRAREEYFSKSFFLAMEVEGYLRETLGSNQDFYLSARSQNEHAGTKPLVRIVLHSGSFVNQPLAVGESVPAQPAHVSGTTAGQSIPSRPQVTPTIGLDGTGQQIGQVQRFDPGYDTGPIDERLVAEQARRASQLIEQTKAKAAERDRRRAAEEKAAARDLLPIEKPQQ